MSLRAVVVALAPLKGEDEWCRRGGQHRSLVEEPKYLRSMLSIAGIS